MTPQNLTEAGKLKFGNPWHMGERITRSAWFRLPRNERQGSTWKGLRYFGELKKEIVYRESEALAKAFYSINPHKRKVQR